MKTTRLSILLALIPLLLLGCEEDSPRTGAIGGQVVQIEDGAGYGPVAVALYDLESLQVVATTVTDDEGNFRLAKLWPGRYTPVVYDEHRVVFHLERPRYEVVAGETVEANIPMTDADFYSDTGVFMEGNVLDRADDSPIPFAVLEVSDFINPPGLWLFSELQGRSGPLAAVSNEEGFFRLGPLPVINDGMGGQFVPHMRIHHPSYEDITLGPWDRFQIPTSRNIRMDRGEDRSVIQGELRYYLYEGSVLTEPVPDVAVAVEWRAGFRKQMLSQISTRSDADGRFEIRGLPAGNYVLLPSYEPDDGWVGQWGQTAQIAAEGDTFVLANPLAMMPAVQLVAPEDGATEAEPAVFDWEDYPDATLYYFAITRGADLVYYDKGGINQSQLIVDSELQRFLEGGNHFSWGVIAYGAPGELSRSERNFTLKR